MELSFKSGLGQLELREMQANNKPIEDWAIHFDVHYEGTNHKNIIFKKVEFSRNIFFENFSNDVMVSFENCKFVKTVRIEESEFREIRFMNCVFAEGFEGFQVTADKMSLSGCNMKAGAEMQELSITEFSIENIVADHNKISFYECDVPSWMISGVLENTEILITSFDRENEQYTDSKIEVFQYNAHSEHKGLFYVVGMSITNIFMYGSNIAGRIKFKDLTVKDVHIGHFTNSGSLSFSKIAHIEKGSLQCIESNMGKCEIYDVDFTRFNEINIENSSIQDIVATNVTWCKKIITAVSGNYKINYQREAYRQLKNVMIRQNDKVQELIYHRYEMDALLYDMRLQKGNWPDRFILWSNGVSNAHGHSWRKALFLLLAISLIVFVSNKLLLGYTRFEGAQIFKNIGLFLESINPVRKFSAIYDESKQGTGPGLAYCIDVIYRIVASYMIFQFISAFRKYVKK